MIYGSICSGIEAATVAWEPLGWKAAWFSEIEAFPSAVLAERWPEVVNLGDMTKIAAAVRAGEVQAPDVMVGGTPCQAFSIAGLRNGLSDARGQENAVFIQVDDDEGVTERDIRFMRQIHGLPVDPPCIAFNSKDYGQDAEEEISPTLRAGCSVSGNQNAGSPPAIAYSMQVRRLMPVECERLQGFPDNHTQISWRGKEATECPDGPRYRAIGNSMAVPVMRWIGERIAAALPAKKSASDYGGSKTPAEQRDLWRTPPALFACLNAEFCFQLDAAAAAHNALCRRFITAEQNTLETPWADYLSIPGYVWLNPPYSDITPFVKKAVAESSNQIGTVMLVPADTSVGWFKEAIQTASEVRFITAGRLAFINPVTGKPVSGNNKGSMLIIWHPYPRTHCHFSTVERDALMNFGSRLIAKREAA
ncbi:TPA: phage N-6-adenine-methyltransferase [Klebsiella pneumoniae]|nr:phage N-6-adenine-methyltransferase [Klebsiella pneumoniae]HBU7898645.1 phage N-6-adenine-methyltransferase [Klebsiella pneumoniae]